MLQSISKIYLGEVAKGKSYQSAMRIYIGSTIPSYVVARPARDLLQAARQQLTKDWWDLKRANEH